MVLFYYNHCKYFISDKTESKTEHYIGNSWLLTLKIPLPLMMSACIKEIQTLLCPMLAVFTHTLASVYVCVLLNM